jgi:hypothetical protein
MPRYRKILLVVVPIGILALGGRLWSHKREMKWQALLLESKKQDKILVAEFGRKMEELQARGLIDNAGALKSELEKYYNAGAWNGTDSNIMIIAEGRYKRSPVAGLTVLAELCRVFDSNAEMSEWISEAFNTFAYKDRDRFVKAVAKVDPVSFDCLPKDFDLSWAEGAPENYQPENEKFLAYLQASPLKENPNIKKLSVQLEYLRK